MATKLTRPLSDSLRAEPLVIPEPRPQDPSADCGQIPVDIYDNKEAFLVVAPLAGLNLDSADVSIRNNVLIISGQRKPALSRFGFKPKDAVSKECFWGTFQRRILLPSYLDPTLIEASEKDHILYIRIPKRERLSLRIVQIRPIT